MLTLCVFLHKSGQNPSQLREVLPEAKDGPQLHGLLTHDLLSRVATHYHSRYMSSPSPSTDVMSPQLRGRIGIAEIPQQGHSYVAGVYTGSKNNYVLTLPPQISSRTSTLLRTLLPKGCLLLARPSHRRGAGSCSSFISSAQM